MIGRFGNSPPYDGLGNRHVLLLVTALTAVVLGGWVVAGLYMTGALGHKSVAPAPLRLPSGSFVPPPSVASSEQSPTRETSIAFSLADGKQGVSFRCALDQGSPVACASPWTYAGLSGGDHVFRVAAVAGHRTSAPTTYRWTVDLTPPRVLWIGRSGVSPTNASSVYWTVAFSESVTGVDLSNFALAGTGTPDASISSVSGSGASYTVAATAGRDGTLALSLVDSGSIEDAAGASLAGRFSAQQPYVIDRTPPPPPAVASSQPSSTGSSEATFRLSDGLPGVTFLCSLDGAAFEPCTGTAEYSGLEPGPHTFQAATLDAVGNLSGVTSSSWTVTGAQPASPPPAAGSTLVLPPTSNPATPSAPASPSTPSSPASPSQPTTTPSTPSHSTIPAHPSTPSHPSAPAHPATPTHPSTPSSPSTPSTPSTPSEPSGPSGSGGSSGPSGPATPPIVIADISVTGDTIAPLYPGGPSVPVNLVFENSTDKPLTVTSVNANVTGTSSAGCSSSWFSFTKTLTAPVVIPAGQTKSLAALGVPQGQWPQLQMANAASQQDPCKGASVDLSYTGLATS